MITVTSLDNNATSDCQVSVTTNDIKVISIYIVAL